MASRAESGVVYAAGVAQGIVLVTFPAAAFGIGPLLDRGIGLPTIYKLSAVIALVMGAWSLVVARRRPSPASLHPHLGHAAE
jgi:hypothetical protein